jgi:hypothetical protein
MSYDLQSGCRFTAQRSVFDKNQSIKREITRGAEVPFFSFLDVNVILKIPERT